jgi:fatty acid/phospholipid biosynthesis enzyme
MPALSFDESNGFEGNVENFLKHMESIDAELGKILRDHIGELKNATYERARKEARATFNAKVVDDLDKLHSEEEAQDD